jgi:hypothetical protein
MLSRIQHFIANYMLDHDLIAKVIYSLLPKTDEKVELTLDRTNWKFGQTNINILVLGVVFPLLFSMMD